MKTLLVLTVAIVTWAVVAGILAKRRGWKIGPGNLGGVLLLLLSLLYAHEAWQKLSLSLVPKLALCGLGLTLGTLLGWYNIVLVKEWLEGHSQDKEDSTAKDGARPPTAK